MTPALLARKDIIQRFPWLLERDLPMVISTDADGLLSAAFLHHHLGWKVAGYYDCATLWLSTLTDHQAKQLVWIDLDVCNPVCPALGHHLLTLSADIPPALDHICNPNLLAGIGLDNYTSKYPFSTIVFLLWLHEIALRRDLLARLLVLHADSSWTNYQQYPDNCRSWQQRLPDYDWNWLFRQVNSDDFKKLITAQLHPRLERTGASPEQVRTRSPSPEPVGGQLRFNPDWDEDIILGLYGLAGTYLKWSPPPIPVITKRLTGNRRTVKLRSGSAKDSIKELIDGGVFSYAIVSRDTINFTHLDW